MNLKKIIFLSILCIFCFSALIYSQPKDAQTAMFLLEQERNYEKEVTSYLQNEIIDRILGKNRATVIYDVEFELMTTSTRSEVKKKELDRTKRFGEIEYILPGIPRPASVNQTEIPGQAREEAGMSEDASLRTRLEIKKQVVTLIYDESVTKSQLDNIVQLIKDTLKMTERGSKGEIITRKAKFTTPPVISKKWTDDFFKPEYLIILLITLLLIGFLFGPLASFLRGYIRAIREKGGTEVTVDSKVEGTPPGFFSQDITRQLQLLEELQKSREEKRKIEEKGKEEYIPFSFVNDNNLRRLIYLLSKEKPDIIVVILSYLKPEYVRQILVSLPPGLQSEVAISLATARQMSYRDVLKLDEQMKKKINYLVGGLDQLLEVINQVDKQTRENILEYIKKERPEIYEKVRKHIFLFEDIVNISDVALQTVIREIKIENLARALRNADKKIVDKFFANMSAGAGNLVREEMEYGRPMTEEQIEEERRKIVETILKFEKEGKIFIREKVRPAITDGLEYVEISETEDMESKAEVNDYFSYGISLYEEGKYAESIPYFEYCIKVLPDFWECYQYLGNVYFNLERYNEALENYQKVLEYRPDNTELKEWIEELKKTKIST